MGGNGSVVGIFDQSKATYVWPDLTMIDNENEHFEIGQIGYQTLFALTVKGRICKAGKRWLLVADRKLEEGRITRWIKLDTCAIRVCDRRHHVIGEDKFESEHPMLVEFATRFDPRGTRIKAHCAICNLPLDSVYADYPKPVCRECDAKALNAEGKPPEHQSCFDSGDNPVYIDGRKCWRRYRFGGYVTMVDLHNCADLEQFYARNRGRSRKLRKARA